MNMRQNLNQLPSDLPKPMDDGKATHLTGTSVPSLSLDSTISGPVNLWETFQQPTVLFIFPRAGSPLEPNKNPELWDTIPGARGCTPQTCSFRDLLSEFNSKGVQVFGMSVQSPHVQKEFVDRQHIPFPLLSDKDHKLLKALDLPTFDFEGELLIKRMAFYIKDGIIQKVFYPVFPPDKNAEEVLRWLNENPK